MAEQIVELAPGESKIVSFEATPSEAKTYQVSVNGLSGSFVATPSPVVGWVSPTSHRDPSGKWFWEEKAYDNDLATVGGVWIDPGEWSPYLELLINETFIDKIRFFGWWSVEIPFPIDVDVYYGGVWHDVYEGAYAHLSWVEKSIAGVQLVSKARVRFYNDVLVRRPASLYEFQFYPV